MKNKNLMNRIIMLLAFLLATSSSFAQITTEEDMAKVVFKTIENNDSEALSYYCISDKRMTKAISTVTDTSAMAKSVINELKEANHNKMKYTVIANFEKFITEIKNKKLNLKDIKYKGLTKNKIKFDIGNLKAKKVNFNVSFDKTSYVIAMYLFVTKSDMFIYDFSFTKPEIKK